MNILTEKEVSFISLDLDATGRVFSYNNRIFRAINHGMEEEVLAFINSQLFNELQEKQMFVKTWICDDVKLEGYTLILEHERIYPITFAYEWSFSMLKDAAILLLDVAILCKKYGYSLKDAHMWNVAFKYSTPIFLDFGSFICDRNIDDYAIRKEFLDHVYIPLKFWACGNFYLANRMLTDDFFHRFLPDSDIYRNCLLLSPRDYMRHFFCRALNKLSRTLIKRNIINSIDSFQNLKKKICKMRKRKSETAWMNYHDTTVKDKNRNLRFKAILDILGKYDVDSMVDIAANQGDFSFYAAENSKIKMILATDYDELALDSLYERAKKTKCNINTMLLNVMFPISSFHSENRKIKMNAVVAMALTHHLILTQKCNINDIFKTLGEYSEKYVLIEFMPLGLWDGKNAPPVPLWYNKEWFSEAFKRHFDLLEEINVEANRIVFFGKHKECNI